MLVRFESPVARPLAEQAAALVGGDLVDGDESLWTDHRERAAGLELTRCLPADVPATIERLRAAGATTIVGRYARGLLFSDVHDPDVNKRGQTPVIQALERRVVEAYGG